jgi:hypothetical protein
MICAQTIALRPRVAQRSSLAVRREGPAVVSLKIHQTIANIAPFGTSVAFDPTPTEAPAAVNPRRVMQARGK